MRGLIILSFAALAVAAPQGYNYPGQQPSNQYLAPIGSGGFGGNGGGASGYQYQQQQQQPLISKRFFIHSAPEEEDVQVQHRDIFVGTPRKNFNVVFVKSPAAAAQKTSIRVIPAVNEDKTVVYVLAKKAGEHEIITHVEETAAPVSKPEVHFIKYKTNQEAEHAQRSIQAEYDHLGGTSDVINEGISPVQSVIGSLNGQGAGNGYSNGAGNGFSNGAGNGFSTGAGSGFSTGAGVSGGAGHGSANSAYLPPVKKH